MGREIDLERTKAWSQWICWERMLGSSVYHAFRRSGPRDTLGHIVGPTKGSPVPECKSFTRTLSDGWFVWVGDEIPGGLCPACATLMGIPKPKRPKPKRRKASTTVSARPKQPR